MKTLIQNIMAVSCFALVLVIGNVSQSFADADVCIVGVTPMEIGGASTIIAAGDEPVDCDPVDLDNDKDLDLKTRLGIISHR